MSIEQGPSYEEEKTENAQNFDDLISETEKKLEISGNKDLKENEDEVEERKKRVQEQSEKKAKAMECIEPLLKEFDHIRKQENFFEGGRYYHALKGNKKGYSEWVEADKERRIAEADINNEMKRQFAEIAGEEEARKQFIVVYPTKEEMKASWSKKKDTTEHLMTDDRKSLAGSFYAISVIRRGAKIREPEQLVKELKENRDYMKSEVYKGHTSEEYENRITDEVYGFHRVAQGFGLAALESGDIKIAAKSLSFAQSIEEMPRDVLDRFDEEFSELNDRQKGEFIIAFKREKEEIEEVK